MISYQVLHFMSRMRIAVPVIPPLIYATPMLFMMGYPMIPKVGAPCRVGNYTRDMACLAGSVTE